MPDTELTRNAMLREALNHLRAAIDLLDRTAAPGEIAAHVDMAANNLAELVDLPQAVFPTPQYPRS